MAFLKVTNLAESTLASGIDDDDTELSVQEGDGAKFPESNFEVVVTKPDHSNFEVMLCSSRSTDTLTVERGAGAVAHDADELVELRVTAGVIENVQEELTTHAGLTTGVHGVGAGTVAKTADITATKLDALTAPDDTTTLDVSTSKHGLAPKAVAPASGLLNVYGIANAETAITNKAIFDNTNPANLNTAAPGTQVVAARRDHVHLNPVTAHTALTAGTHWANADGVLTFTNQSGAKMWLSGAKQSIPTDTWTKILHDAVDYDNQSEVDIVNSKVVIKYAGVYLIHAKVALEGIDADKFGVSEIRRNGSRISHEKLYTNEVGWVIITAVALNKLDVNDYIEGYAYHNHGSNRDLLNAIGDTFLTIQKIA